MYIVAGGTVDISAHEILDDNELRELHGASGGAWGGTEVDKAFEQFFADIIGIQPIMTLLNIRFHGER